MTLRKFFTAIAGIGLFMAGILLGANALGTRAQTSSQDSSPGPKIQSSQPQLEKQSEVRNSTEVSETVDLMDTVGVSEAAEMGHYDEISGTAELTDTFELDHHGELSGTMEMTDTVELGQHDELSGTVEMTDTIEMGHHDELSGTVEMTETIGLTDTVEMNAALTAQATVTQQQAEATVLAANPGKTIAKARLGNKHGVLAYRVMLSDNSRVTVDAKTGQIIKEQSYPDGNK